MEKWEQLVFVRGYLYRVRIPFAMASLYQPLLSNLWDMILMLMRSVGGGQTDMSCLFFLLLIKK